MDRSEIDLVFDVGANRGQYAEALRENGYRGRIVSFEPLSEPLHELEHRASSDNAWECRQIALGDEATTATMNVSKMTETSSFLKMKDWFSSEFPPAACVGEEDVTIVPLDSLSGELRSTNDRAMLKLDVQGYEDRVLKSAVDTLPEISLLECELSLEALYDGESLIGEMLSTLELAGFAPLSLEPTGYLPPSGHVPQVNGIFVNRRLA